MDLTVIILNWNTLEDTRKAIRSFLHFQYQHAIELIVVDNASSDGSAVQIKAEFPSVFLLISTHNLGFGAGNNSAIAHSSGRYVLFLNSDTELTEGALDTLITCADSNPDIGILGPRLLNGDGSLQYSCRHFPNLGTGFFRNTPLGRLFPTNRFTQDYLMTDFDHLTHRDVDWVSGAALFIRRDLVQKLKGFDQDFYMYCEDVDLCWRAHIMGQRVVYCPDAVIYHHIGRSSDKVPARMTYHFHRSMYIFYRKHYAAQTPIWIRPLILPGLLARSIGKVVRYRWTGICRAYIKKQKGKHDHAR